MTTLINRPNSNIKCDDTIVNDDVKFVLEVVKQIGCVPIYWKQILPPERDFEECKTAEQLRDASYLLSNYRDVLASYDPPCVDMTMLANVHNIFRQTDNKFQIMVRYVDDFYQRIENVKSVEFETFFSGVGGFVGIFCGYSIMQVPELVEKILPHIKRPSIAIISGKCYEISNLL